MPQELLPTLRARSLLRKRNRASIPMPVQKGQEIEDAGRNATTKRGCQRGIHVGWPAVGMLKSQKNGSCNASSKLGRHSRAAAPAARQRSLPAARVPRGLCLRGCCCSSAGAAKPLCCPFLQPRRLSCPPSDAPCRRPAAPRPAARCCAPCTQRAAPRGRQQGWRASLWQEEAWMIRFGQCGRQGIIRHRSEAAHAGRPTSAGSRQHGRDRDA